MFDVTAEFFFMPQIIRVNQCDVLPIRIANARIARTRKTAIDLRNNANTRVFETLANRKALIVPTIVYEDEFEVSICLP